MRVPGAKTVLPAGATAKLDFRLVPDMDPKTQLARLREHLRSGGFGDIRVRMSISGPAGLGTYG